MSFSGSEYFDSFKYHYQNFFIRNAFIIPIFLVFLARSLFGKYTESPQNSSILYCGIVLCLLLSAIPTAYFESSNMSENDYIENNIDSEKSIKTLVENEK